ncbi:MAG: hypothetical protein IJ808_08895 [Muribaculaceae bacterium]|nr:hypothetical protein [Muribaculaceae bacterium]
MNEYICYTLEGYTIAPNENVEVNNCQMLGRAFGHDQQEAKTLLIKENPWIEEAGFDVNEIMVEQIMPK